MLKEYCILFLKQTRLKREVERHGFKINFPLYDFMGLARTVISSDKVLKARAKKVLRKKIFVVELVMHDECDLGSSDFS